jgi:predicted amidophosphoribosyltransferase
MTSEFVELHGECIGAFDEIVPIPSSMRNAPQSVVGRVHSLRTRASNSTQALRTLGHGEYDADAFRAAPSPGRRVLLFDHTFTSGAAVFSAAAAARSSGADVIGVLVIGRHVNPAWEPNEVMLKWLTATAWTPDKCCECRPARPSGMLW